MHFPVIFQRSVDTDHLSLIRPCPLDGAKGTLAIAASEGESGTGNLAFSGIHGEDTVYPIILVNLGVKIGGGERHVATL